MERGLGAELNDVGGSLLRGVWVKGWTFHMDGQLSQRFGLRSGGRGGWSGLRGSMGNGLPSWQDPGLPVRATQQAPCPGHGRMGVGKHNPGPDTGFLRARVLLLV